MGTLQAQPVKRAGHRKQMKKRLGRNLKLSGCGMVNVLQWKQVPPLSHKHAPFNYCINYENVAFSLARPGWFNPFVDNQTAITFNRWSSTFVQHASHHHFFCTAMFVSL